MDDIERLNILEEFYEFLAKNGLSIRRDKLIITREEWEKLKLEFIQNR